LGADETFYGLPILVAIELASGFIFSEAECEHRSYKTWWEQVVGGLTVSNGSVGVWSVMGQRRWSNWR
jgi:hypothetical protein